MGNAAAGRRRSGRNRGDVGLALGLARVERTTFRVELAEPAQTRALRGKKRHAKNDRLDARWLALFLAKEMLPRSWIPPEDIQRLRDLTRLRQALRHDRTSWAQRLHSVLAHEGWPCSRSRLVSTGGQRWLAALTLDAHVRGIVDAHLAILDAISTQVVEVERELRSLARSDRRLLALQTIYGVCPIVASHLLAEIGDERRFRRADQVVRVAGLDPVVLDSADNRRRGKLSKQGSPHLRWALVQAAQHAAIHPASCPDGGHDLASSSGSAASAPPSRPHAGSPSVPTTCSQRSRTPPEQPHR
jgi:transposase